MSVSALLSHFGIKAARFVTSTGEIVFSGVTKADDGFRHAAHGNVTPVANHTFHGGSQEPEEEANGTVWWEDRERLERNVRAMNASFPNFSYLPSEDGAVPCWGGVIDTGRGKFNVGIFTRRDGGLPTVSVLHQRLGAPAGRRLQRPPHLYDNGDLCVADRSDWDPERHTVATVAAWAAHWLAAYTEWRMSRRWPVEGVHAVA